MLKRLGAIVGLLAVGIWLTACGGSTHTVTVTTPSTSAGTLTSTGTNGVSSAKHPKSGTKSNSPSGQTKDAQTTASGTPTGGGSQSSSSNSGTPPSSGVTAHQLNNIESVHIVSHQGPYIIQQGVVTGPPIGNGTVVMRDRLTGTSVVVQFTVRGSQGSVDGLGTAQLVVSRGGVTYRGTAHVVSGTGIYTHVSAPHLTVIGSGSIAGNTTLHVTGVEWY